jgi:hypothetical protein
MALPLIVNLTHDYFNRITVSSPTFNTTPDVQFGIKGNPSFSMINEGTGTITYSFDGTNIFGDMVPGTPSAQMVFNNRGYSKIWFQLSSGAASNVRIEATADGTIGIGSVSATAANPLPVTMEAGSFTVGKVQIEDTNGATIAVGQTTMSASLPVTIASNQTAIPGNITQVAGSPLSLGQTTMSASLPVVMASNQNAIPVTITNDGYNDILGEVVCVGPVLAPAGSAPLGSPVQVGAVYSGTAPTPSSGSIEPLQLDSLGNLQTNMYTLISGEDLSNNLIATINKPVAASTYAPTAFVNLSANVTLNIKATAGVVVSLTCINTTSTIRYMMLHNSTTTSSGAPQEQFLVPGFTQIVIGTDYFTTAGKWFSTGICFGISTTVNTYTAASATDCAVTVSYY